MSACSPYGEPMAYPVADLDMDGQVTSADLTAWTDLKAGGSSASAYGLDLDLDFDDSYGPGEADEDLFWESYDANLGLSGKGRVSTLGVASRVGYAGYQWDQVARAYHVRYRVYLPEIGRWTRRDPLGYVDGPSQYQYVRARPVVETDAMGLMTASRVSPILDSDNYADDDLIEPPVISPGWNPVPGTNPAELTFCRLNPLDCRRINRYKNRLLERLKKRWDWAWWPGADSSVHNAVVHCSLACILSNISGGKEDYWRWLVLHEAWQTDSCASIMDMDNNAEGWSIRVPNPVLDDSDHRLDWVIHACIRACEAKANAGRLTWLQPKIVAPEKATPDVLPNKPFNLQPGGAAEANGCCPR
jgi:RHS repeat-associated protein